ncbi:MAG TPA: UvrD-helicase domain-containing protein [Phycisphaerales bacterium]|nr:UvrD-helicase domain-containing protein [Phycisphaerales bacterium]
MGDAQNDTGVPPWLEDSGPGDAPASDWTASLLEDLTEPQRRAVLHTEGPLLVLAAAGSGKTRVITRRIAYLVGCGVPAWSILAVTFTNKAAGEMRERVERLLGGAGSRSGRGLTVTTFHSLCARLLRRYAEQAGLRPDFSIYDSGDQSALVKKVIESLQLSTANFPARSVLSAISAAKNDLLDAKGYAARAIDFSGRTIAKIYAGYERALRGANAADFDDLLLLTARMLRENEAVAGELRQRWQYLLIDEYQDTNKAQFVIASGLAGKGRPDTRGPNICVVGDPDQAIYGWRGADITNILEFEQAYPGCEVITLGENFRSTAPILAVADKLIRHNARRKHKDLFTKRSGGQPVEAVLCRDERHEAKLVVDWLRSLRDASGTGDGVRAGHAWKDMAVFYRTNALSRVMEEAFREAGVPYTIARGTAFYEREEVKSATAYLRVIANQADDVSLGRIINTPARGISDATVARLESRAAETGVPMMSALRELADSPALAAPMGLTPRAAASVQRFVGLMNSWTGAGSFMGEQITGSLADLVDRAIKESGLEDMYRKQARQSQSETDAERLDNLAELVSSARQFEMEYDPAADAALDGSADGTPPLLAMLRAYLESIALVSDADTIDPALGSVTLMTLHAAKGLEFAGVAIVGLEEGLLPHARALSSGNPDDMEEERRLCFVGVTRAMRRLLLTSAKYRTIRGASERTTPSRFLAEMPQEHLAVRDLAGDDTQWDPGPEFEPDVAVARKKSEVAGMFPPGCLVRHPQFGVGTVKSLTGGAQARALIDFRDVGVKTLILEYARLTKLR